MRTTRRSCSAILAISLLFVVATTQIAIPLITEVNKVVMLSRFNIAPPPCNEGFTLGFHGKNSGNPFPKMLIFRSNQCL